VQFGAPFTRRFMQAGPVTTPRERHRTKASRASSGRPAASRATPGTGSAGVSELRPCPADRSRAGDRGTGPQAPTRRAAREPSCQDPVVLTPRVSEVRRPWTDPTPPPVPEVSRRWSRTPAEYRPDAALWSPRPAFSGGTHHAVPGTRPALTLLQCPALCQPGRWRSPGPSTSPSQKSGGKRTLNRAPAQALLPDEASPARSPGGSSAGAAAARTARRTSPPRS
jgi:hypothetical protein